MITILKMFPKTIEGSFNKVNALERPGIIDLQLGMGGMGGDGAPLPFLISSSQFPFILWLCFGM